MSHVPSSPLRFGILGTARIARSFAEGVKRSAHVAVSAVASRDAAKARSFAQETGLARHFASYEALLADRDIDAVYIPLPNSLHAEWSGAAPEESIDNMLTLDAIHASARGGGAIEIPPQA